MASRQLPEGDQCAAAVRPVLAITMGDAAGIGAEIIVKSLSRRSVYEMCRPLVIGDVQTMNAHLRFALPDAPPFRVRPVAGPEEARFEYGTIDVLQPGESLRGIVAGSLSAEAGRGAVAFVRAAAALARDGRADGIVTAPLNKAAMNLAGYHYPGHTELLADFFGVRRYSLVLTANGLFVFHVTTHVGLREATDLITRERVLGVVELAHRFAMALGRADETIAVSGLNPHAGEGGLFGTEEAAAILPAVATARQRGIPVEGPVPGDALFPRALKGAYNFVIAMYHDQGHIPFKTAFFDQGVNITVGLPVIRTSVDHGTAFDIAGKGVASEESLLEAIALAARLAPHWSKVWEAVQDAL
ncbi:4-hydroxythreonine-4-phosphate dehydrogenase PdxA [Symbiobacterium terraclitae]|uniref:4-hydroxythreonine-4-phosphate dehydrogenase PdxA n=1 Tax=Symbiobacterium terraclitae TaxID=557451 RepID=UPI0035B54AA4